MSEENTEQVNDDASRTEAAIGALNQSREETQETQEETQEVKTEESQEKYEKQDEDKSALYAKIAEQDQQIVSLRKKMKSGQSLEDLKAKAAENPSAILEELGIDPDSLLDIWAGGVGEKEETQEETKQENPEIIELKRKLEQLESQQKNKTFEEQRITEKQRIGSVVEKNPEKWQLVRALQNVGSYDATLEYAISQYQKNIEEGLDETEAVPDYQKVLDTVEETYKKNILQTIEFAKKIDVFKEHFGGAEQKQSRETVTLSSGNNDTASPHDPDDEERFKNALAVLQAERQKGDEW